MEKKITTDDIFSAEDENDIMLGAACNSYEELQELEAAIANGEEGWAALARIQGKPAPTIN